MFGCDSPTGTVTLTLGTFALYSGLASYGLDPSIGSNASGVNLSRPVPEPSTWALLLVGCLGRMFSAGSWGSSCGILPSRCCWRAFRFTSGRPVGGGP